MGLKNSCQKITKSKISSALRNNEGYSVREWREVWKWGVCAHTRRRGSWISAFTRI